MTIFEITEKVLTESGKYSSSDGKLLRNLVLENAEKMDRELLSCLLKNEETKKAYFTEVDGVQVFDKVKFSWLIQNKEFLPDSYTRYKNKIGLANSRGEFISASGDVELVFPYKDCILEGGQTKEDQKNNEIFYNETLAPDQVSTLLSPKAFCNAKRYSAKPQMNADKNNPQIDTEAQSAHTDKKNICVNLESSLLVPSVDESPCTQITDTDNLIIKGNNLLALSSLLQRYRAKVKLIYIDPPYNTGGDSFGYNDNFNHSTWLVFMKNRLKLAKQLLSADGCIFVQCDDNEQAYLKVLMDEIFGRENFVATFPWRKRTAKSDVPFGVSQDYEWILCYAESENFKASIEGKERKYFETDDFPNRPWRFHDLTKQTTASERPNSFFTIINPKNGDEFPANPNRTWAVTKETFEDYYKQDRIIFPGDYDFLKISKPVLRYWKEDDMKKSGDDFGKIQVSTKLPDSVGMSQNGSKEMQALFGSKAFAYPKTETLIKFIIEISTQENDLVLDFHLGSGTTAAAAHKMRRRYIGVEQMDYIETVTCERLKKVISGEQGGISKAAGWQGGGSFVYCELAKLNQNFVDKIQACQTDAQIKSVTDEILKLDFVSSKVKPSDIKTSAKDYSELTFEEKQRLAFALLDKNQLYVNFSERRDPDMKLSENDIKFSESFYGGIIVTRY